ncbi:MAG: hypothetical protein COB51_04030 [Moraxellaceae bacterium]|nr:MAG: hypothetical protein COB51_04030 [Moraxellaceae bacterium]
MNHFSDAIKRSVFVLLIAIAIPVFFDRPTLYAASFSSPEWQLGKQEDGIQIYTRRATGYASTAREIKAVTYTDAPPENCVALVTDYESSSLWRKRIKELKVVETIDSNHWQLQVITDLPWPLRDRKMTADVQLIHDPSDNSYTYQIESTPSDEASGLDEDELFRGIYKFIPDENGGSKVIYQILFVSPIRIPNWLMDLMIHQTFVGQLKQFRKLVIQPKYHATAETVLGQT